MSKLNAAILDSFRRHKRRKYLVGANDVTYAALETDALAVSEHFNSSSLAGERMVLATRDDRALLTCFIAALNSGVTSVIVDPRAPVPELSTLVAAADAKAIVADTGVMEGLDEAGSLEGVAQRIRIGGNAGPSKKGGLRLFSGRQDKAGDDDIGTLAGILNRHKGARPGHADTGEEAIAYILFTSGTTSRPKGVMISHRALHAQMRTFITNYGLSDQSAVMNLLPFHHTDGLTQGAVMCLLAGSTFVRPYAFSPDMLPQVMTDLYKYAVSHLVTVPSVLALTRTLDNSFADSFEHPEFKFIISTAAYLDPALWQDCEERFGVQIVNVYGLTETVCETMYCGPDPSCRRMGAVGKPIDSLAKIVDEAGNELGDEQEGELLVAGDHIMSGYFNNPEETADVLQDGWFRTGDTARRDKDGFYFIVGRKKDLIISGGMNIYPEDVNGILRNIPGVIDAATFGLPDPMWGERAVSCIICDESTDPSIETITAEFLKRGSRQKLPRDIVKLDAFPRGPAGKVVMSEVKALAVRRLSQQVAEDERGASEGGVPAKIYSIAAGILRCPAEQLAPESDSETVSNWTSLNHVEMMLALEDAFGFKFSPREIMKFRTLGDAIDIVQKRTAA